MKKILFSLLFGFFCLGMGGGLITNTAFAQGENPDPKDPPAPTEENPEKTPDKGDNNMGINITPECMLGVGCKFDIQKTLGFKKNTGNEEETSVLLFVQDVILAATMFIGTVVTIVLIFSGVLFIVAGRKGDAGLQKKATQGILYAIIGLVLVTCSYGIIQGFRYIVST